MSTVKTLFLEPCKYYLKIIGWAVFPVLDLESKIPAIPIIKKLQPIIKVKVTRNLKKVELNMKIIIYHNLEIIKHFKK